MQDEQNPPSMDLVEMQQYLNLKILNTADMQSDKWNIKNGLYILDVKANTTIKGEILIPHFSQQRDLIATCVDFAGVEIEAEELINIIENCDIHTTVLYNLSENIISAKVKRIIENHQVKVYSFSTLEQGRRYYGYGEKKLPFVELLLNGPDNLTIFEHNTIVKLQTELTTDEASSDRFSGKLRGFKISRSHFRLGSKIHITNFYYAKRLFQNSYYSSRFAFLLAKTILSEHIPQIRNKKKPSENKSQIYKLTLIGYGSYSEILLNIVERLLSRHLKDFLINHDLISDEEELQRVKKNEELYENVVLVIPIASTFSTSIKIEDALNKEYSEVKIIEPHLNIINVYDSQGSHQSEPSEIEKRFWWEDINHDDKQITVKGPFSGPNDPKKIQRFFIRLPTNWYDVKDCELCFHEDPTREVPLFITDKTSVTPILIFDTPRGRIINKHEKFILTSQMVRHGHYSDGRNHYEYLLDRELFFKKNRKRIKNWLEKISTEKRLTYLTSLPNVTLIAPGNFTNAGFANLVNEILFKNTANLIHYDPIQDHIQNFNAFYSEVINEHGEKSPVIFVDDAMITGRTFNECNFLVRHTRSSGSGFDGCLVLIDRSSHFVSQDVLIALGGQKDNYFSFANIHLPSINNFDGSCPLCKETERYSNLTSQSFLDKLKVHFLTRQNKLQIKESNKPIAFRESSNRYISRIEVIHQIYTWFSNTRALSTDSFKKYTSMESWIDDVMRNNNSPFNISTIKSEDKEYLKDIFIKVLSQSPLIHYKPIRERTFKWLLEYLDDHVKKIKQEISLGTLEYLSYRKLKFLIRRAGLLNTNYLMSQNFFEFLLIFLSDRGIKLLNRKIQAKSAEHKGKKGDLGLRKKYQNQLESLNNFKIFFIAQIKELIFLNEARSIRLEETLITLSAMPQLPPEFKQLVRILREENGILIQIFMDFISKEKSWGNKLTSSSDIAQVQAFLKEPNISNHTKFRTLNDFLTLRGNGLGSNLVNDTTFLNYVHLVHNLSHEKSSHEALSKKTKQIVEKLKEIVFDGDIHYGAQLIVKYKRDNTDQIFFAYNHGSKGSLEEFTMDDDNKFLYKMLFGYQDSTGLSNLTVIEFHRRNDNDSSPWENLYVGDPERLSSESLGNIPVSKEYNRLLILRINKRYFRDDLDNDTPTDDPQGLICFYSKQPNYRPTDISKIRYLLLLRSHLSDFIHNHHENNEFRDWIDANVKQRTSLLSGHGRDMLISLANVVESRERYKSILATILFTQRYLIDITDFMEVDYRLDKGEFRNFFNMRYDKVDKAYLRDIIKPMAIELFHYDIIENRDDVNVSISMDFPYFNFSHRILEAILFELIVNAKKNRYIFLRDVKTLDAKGNVIKENKIDIRVWKIKGNKNLIGLSVYNTCSYLPKRQVDALNNKTQNAKGPNSISGIELISTMLKSFDLGKIWFDVKEINKQDFLHKFEAKLILNDHAAS